MSSDIPHLDQLTYDYITGALTTPDYRSRKLDEMEIWDVEERDTYDWGGFDGGQYALSDQNAEPDQLTGLDHTRGNQYYIDRAHALKDFLGTATPADPATGQKYSSGKFLPPPAVINEARREYEASLPPTPTLTRGTPENDRLREIFDAAQVYANLPAPVTLRQTPVYSAAPTAASPGLFADVSASPFADSYDAFGIPVAASAPAVGATTSVPVTRRTTTVSPEVPGPESIWSDPAVWGLDEFPLIPQESVIDPNDEDTGDQATLPGMDEQLSPMSMAIASVIFGAAGLGLPFTVMRGYDHFFGEGFDPGPDYLGGFDIDPMEFGGIGGPADADDTADVVDTIGVFDEDMGEGEDAFEF